jgi:mannose-P-dolichol utilization defect protein 1
VRALQVANVLRARSAEGLSALSFELESWGLLVHATYGFLRGLPFSAYGEAVMMLAQNVLLLALVYKYARMPASRALAAIVVGVSAVAGVFTGEWWVWVLTVVLLTLGVVWCTKVRLLPGG